MKTQRIVLISLAIISIILSCGKDDGGNNISFTDLFTNTSENIIQPQYAKYNSHVGQLSLATEVFINDVNLTNLTALQSVFEENYKMWQHTSLFEFGPAVDADILLKPSINSYPTKVNIIESNINSGSYNLDGANNIYASGLPAFEYLIYGTTKNNSDVLDKFTTGTSSSNRKKYLQDLIAKMYEKTNLVVERWDTYHTKYISNNGTGNSSSITLLFNAYLKDYEETKRNKFALPAGYATEYSIPVAKDAEKLEGLYSDLSIDLIKESINAHHSFFKGIGLDGIDGIGFEDKLIELKAKSTVVDGALDEVSNIQYNEIKDELSLHNSSLYTDIVNDKPSLSVLSLKLQKLVPMIKIDMKTYFGVPITSQDTDGD